MILNLSKTLMVLLICLAFIGQVMASTVMSYNMMSMQGMSHDRQMSQSEQHDMPMMDHSSHTMSDTVKVSDSNSDNGDCCPSMCKCFTGGCSNIATLTKDINTVVFTEFSSKIHSISNLALSLQPTSLYRPPIIS
ncbi:hypothetical protein [Psychrosphaera sp. F3M07]|uniref:hypothetical protein n=1 Tax=Psychrosphaera sp. F3M07 TaxID=2841560 RepID=UPI0035302F31